MPADHAVPLTRRLVDCQFSTESRGRRQASDNDPYAELPWSIRTAFDWGSEVSVLASAGHINSDSHLGGWPEGRPLLRDFVDAQSRLALDRAA
ncbi:MAG TPA: alpha/beta hydrolase [Kofleriaceae bacterium]